MRAAAVVQVTASDDQLNSDSAPESADRADHDGEPQPASTEIVQSSAPDDEAGLGSERDPTDEMNDDGEPQPATTDAAASGEMD